MEKHQTMTQLTPIPKTPIVMAIFAALLYGISAPFSKLLLKEIPPALMASLLYLGAGGGMLILSILTKRFVPMRKEAKLTRKELPYTLAMIVLDILAPIFLMIGLTMTSSENASLLNNFEIVATALIASLAFKEAIGKRMWVAIFLITFSSIVLTVQSIEGFTFSIGSVFVLAACICWGLENNCTRMLSMKDPLQIVVLKGFGAGAGSLLVAFALKQSTNAIIYVLFALLLGFVAYGLSIFFYVVAQRDLGAGRTSAYYAAAPFIGVLISWVVFHEAITTNFIIALIVMILGTWFAVSEKHGHLHRHLAEVHEHKHRHDDGHHDHHHDETILGEHSHPHVHQPLQHRHAHTPDIHHRHTH